MKELVQIFDHEGKILDPITFGEALINQKVFYGVCSVWIINPEGLILCSKRSDKAKIDSGLWQSFFGGKLKAGENHERAAVRELAEEIGLTITETDLTLVDCGFNHKFRRYYKVYLLIFTGGDNELKPDGKEISGLRWLSLDEYNDKISIEPQLWTNVYGRKHRDKIKTWYSRIHNQPLISKQPDALVNKIDAKKAVASV